MKLNLVFKKFNKKIIIFIFASILLISGLAIAAFWLVIGYGKVISPGSLIEARDINEMACELVFTCGHDCGYTMNQKFGCQQFYCGYKTISADSWAWLGSCDRPGCQCGGGNCQTSGPVHAGNPVTAEDLNRIIASIKDRAHGWCTLFDPDISGVGFVSPGDPILASKMNDVRKALDYLTGQQYQCAAGPKCCTMRFFVSKAACQANDDYAPPAHFPPGPGCNQGICAACNDGRWGLIGCENDPAGFGPCAPGVCLWPGCFF